MRRLSFIFTLLLGINSMAQTNSDHATTQDATRNQVQLTLTDGASKYYNTADIQELTFDNGQVTAGQDQYNNVASVSFAKAITAKVNITETKGWLESAYVKFDAFSNIKTYNVYIKGGQYSDYTRIDRELVRNYGSYGRADAVGLKAGNDYRLKVVPVNGDGSELTQFASETELIEVKNYSRQGFAFMGYTPGAYNADGTLKNGAKVLYVTKHNFNTVQLEMTKDSKGNKETYTGLGEIFKAMQKGFFDTPLAVRFIGEISTDDAASEQLMSDEKGLQLKGNNENIVMHTTLEGIGDDASFNGFGMTFFNGTSVEMRNIGLVNFNDDGIQLKGTQYAWIHHNDFFYGNAGSAADQKKGDGSLDVKDDSRYCTFSYNHFWDSGKTSLCGMKSESGDNFISYDHNWFDHSDSRHPRVRKMSVHIWNNYYDGVAKIGAGAVAGANLFVESNYFRNSKNPMLISEQGTDGRNGFADDHDGGMIKAYGNILTGKSATTFIPHTQNNVEFDAYVATSRSETVPSTYKSVVGNYTYNNFDTNPSLMYSYSPDAASEIPAIVTGYYGAGRMNHGDLQWTFNNDTDDTKDAVDDALKTLLTGYHNNALLGIFGEEVAPSDGGSGGQGGNEPTPEGTIACSFDKSGVPSNSFFTVSGNGSDSKGKATVDGVEYTTCLKMESATSIKFTLTDKRKMTLYFADTETASIKINDTKISGSGSTYSQTLEPGSYELKKDKSVNLFYIKLEPIAE